MESWSSGWNVVSGCTAISDGCKNCWAKSFNNRMHSHWKTNKDFTEITLRHTWLGPTDSHNPSNWKQPRKVVTSQMGDLFQDKVPDDFIFQVFSVMAQATKQTFRVLTKRSSRLVSLSPHLQQSKNIWLGVSVENMKVSDRISDLQNISWSGKKFINFEPLLGLISDVSLEGIDWVICGSESGGKARKTETEWFLSVIGLCKTCQVPLWIKQVNGLKGEKATVDGKLYRTIL